MHWKCKASTGGHRRELFLNVLLSAAQGFCYWSERCLRRIPAVQRKRRPPLRCRESSCCISSMGLLCQCRTLGHVPSAVLADCVLCSSWLISSYWNNYVIWVATAQHGALWIWAPGTAGWNKGCEKRKLMISCLLEAMTQLALDSAILSLDSLGTGLSFSICSQDTLHPLRLNVGEWVRGVKVGTGTLELKGIQAFLPSWEFTQAPLCWRQGRGHVIGGHVIGGCAHCPYPCWTHQV